MFKNDFFRELVVDFTDLKETINELFSGQYTKEGLYQIEMALPGIKKSDISLGYDGNYLQLTYKDRQNIQKEQKWYIPNELDQSTTTAKLEDGLLVISIGKNTKKTLTNIKIE